MSLSQAAVPNLVLATVPTTQPHSFNPKNLTSLNDNMKDIGQVLAAAAGLFSARTQWNDSTLPLDKKFRFDLLVHEFKIMRELLTHTRQWQDESFKQTVETLIQAAEKANVKDVASIETLKKTYQHFERVLFKTWKSEITDPVKARHLIKDNPYISTSVLHLSGTLIECLKQIKAQTQQPLTLKDLKDSEDNKKAQINLGVMINPNLEDLLEALNQAAKSQGFLPSFKLDKDTIATSKKLVAQVNQLLHHPNPNWGDLFDVLFKIVAVVEKQDKDGPYVAKILVEILAQMRNFVRMEGLDIEAPSFIAGFLKMFKLSLSTELRDEIKIIDKVIKDCEDFKIPSIQNDPIQSPKSYNKIKVLYVLLLVLAALAALLAVLLSTLLAKGVVSMNADAVTIAVSLLTLVAGAAGTLAFTTVRTKMMAHPYYSYAKQKETTAEKIGISLLTAIIQGTSGADATSKDLKSLFENISGSFALTLNQSIVGKVLPLAKWSKTHLDVSAQDVAKTLTIIDGVVPGFEDSFKSHNLNLNQLPESLAKDFETLKKQSITLKDKLKEIIDADCDKEAVNAARKTISRGIEALNETSQNLYKSLHVYAVTQFATNTQDKEKTSSETPPANPPNDSKDAPETNKPSIPKNPTDEGEGDTPKSGEESEPPVSVPPKIPKIPPLTPPGIHPVLIPVEGIEIEARNTATQRMLVFKNKNLKISFEPSSSNLIIKDGVDAIDLLFKFMEKNPNIRVKITGHTDNIGSLAGNLKLSEERARAVMNALMKKGIAANRVIVEGLGDKEPVADNSTLEGRALNRRIEIQIQ